MRAISIILLVLLSSCSSNYYLKRSQQLERKAIMLGAVVKHDTVFIDREVIVPEKQMDTLVQHVNFHDTITVIQKRIVTKVKVDTIHHTIYVNTICPPDTVKVKVPITVVKHVETSGGIPWWIWLIIGSMGFMILVVIIKK